MIKDITSRKIAFVGSSRDDIRVFPDAVKLDIGYALFEAQRGRTPAHTKSMKGFGGPDVFEIVRRYDGGAYRAVYTTEFGRMIYVLHCFQKKSPSGIKTPKRDVNLIQRRLRTLEEEYHEHQ